MGSITRFMITLGLLGILSSLLQAQYQGVLTSVDHAPGNISTTSIEGMTSGIIGIQQKTIPSNSSGSVTAKLPFSDAKSAPFSRSYYLWAETTSSTLFAGDLPTVLLAAATVNGYEDIATISIIGPKTGVDATRWDLPMNLNITYALSAGALPLGETPTTATSYSRSGSAASFASTEATPQVAIAYKTSPDGAAEGNWSNAYALTAGTETKAMLIPSTLETLVNQPYFSSSTFSNFHLALMQSSIREVAAYSTFRIFPFPTPTPHFSSNLGTPTRNEKIGNTTYLAYSLQTDSAALPTLTLAASNGFPLTRWEILHIKPDGDSKSQLNTAAGSNPTNPVSLDPTNLKLNELIQTAGTHTFRLYNRFDEASIAEEKELIFELTLVIQFVVKVKAHIHTYE